MARVHLVNRSGTSIPVFSLPPELLSHIFLLDKRDQELESIGDPEMSQTAQSVPREEVFTHVCHHFRSVALTTASLWTTIHVPCCSSSLARVEAYCQRSQSAPLDVRVVVCPGCQSSAVRDMIQVVLCHAQRWRKLSVAARDLSTVRLLSSRHTAALEFLTLSVDSVDMEDPSISQDNLTLRNVFIQGTFNLKFLRLRGMALHLFRPPLQQLTTFHLDQTNNIPISYATFKELLTETKILAHLSVYGETITTSEWPLAPTPTSVIHLPALLSLRICGTDGRIFKGILANIQSPILRSLTLKDMQESDIDGEWDDPRSTIAFRELTELTFCDFDISEKQYRFFFRLFPSIKLFSSFSSTIGTTKIYKPLSQPYTPGFQQVPWPHLQTLWFGFDPSDDPGLVEDLLLERQQSLCPLTELRFATTDRDGVHLWLEDIDSCGVDMTTASTVEQWPPSSGMQYLDRDDILFD